MEPRLFIRDAFRHSDVLGFVVYPHDQHRVGPVRPGLIVLVTDATAPVGREVGSLAVGKRADLLVLDSEHPNLAGIDSADVLSTFVFCGNDNLVRDVMVGGRWVVRGQRHVAQESIAKRYMHAIAELRTLRS